MNEIRRPSLAQHRDVLHPPHARRDAILEEIPRRDECGSASRQGGRIERRYEASCYAPGPDSASKRASFDVRPTSGINWCHSTTLKRHSLRYLCRWKHAIVYRLSGRNGMQPQWFFVPERDAFSNFHEALCPIKPPINYGLPPLCPNRNKNVYCAAIEFNAC
ncbi:hypothetical protein TcasGA2_TC006387 [Tribolium castaneum]|uniref:Uncharacterized protein n=1 Tax=Tribolium castaneum TaxID=7070 RepID=D6WWI7_TRICA|nr:hypothetical protein TcasGA2_TC006387 [Tribolium castaneum]